MLQKLLKHSFLFLAAALLLGSCKEEYCEDPNNPTCRDYDPCFGSAFVTDVHLTETGYTVEGVRFLMPADRVLTPGDILLSLNDPYADSIRWRIGAEANYRYGDSIYVTFGEEYDEEIPVEVTVFKARAKACGINEEGSLSFTYMLPLVPQSACILPGIEGFLGTSTQSGDKTFVVKIGEPFPIAVYPQIYYDGAMILQNLPDGCFYSGLSDVPLDTDVMIIMYAVGDRHFRFSCGQWGGWPPFQNPPICGAPRGYGYVSFEGGDTLVHINYSAIDAEAFVQGQPTPRRSFTFTGKKLPE